MHIHEELRKAGLNANETSVYLYLLENGQSSPPQIAKGSKIALTNSYHVLRALYEKGVLEKHAKGKRQTYSPKDPMAVLQRLDLERERFSGVIPDLRALFLTCKNKPKVHFYDGLNQVMEIFTRSLEAKGEILGVASIKQLFASAPSGYFQKHRKELKKREIFFRDLLTSDSDQVAAKEAKAEMGVYYDYRFLPKEFGDVPSDILIWNNSVAMMSLEAPLFGTVLENENVAKTLRVLFNMAWEKGRLPA